MKNRPVLKTEEAIVQNKLPALVIDKQGIVGEKMSEELSKDFLVVFATAEKIKSKGRIIPISYRKKVLQIPDNTFAHIFLVIDASGEGKDILYPVLKKAKQANATLTVIISYNAKKTLIREIIEITKKLYPTVVFVVGDIIGVGTSKVDDFVQNAKRKGQVVLPNDGLEESFPVPLDLTVNEVIRLTLLSRRVHKTLLLYPRFGITDLSLARIIAKYIPDLSIAFKKQQKEKKGEVFTEGEYVIEDFHLEGYIRHMVEEQDAAREKSKPKKKSSKRRNKIILAIIGIILAPFLITIIFGLSGFFAAKSAFDRLEKGDLSAAEKRFSIAQNSFLLSAETAKNIHSVTRSVGIHQGDDMLNLLELGQSVSDAGKEGVSSGRLLMNVFIGASKNPDEDIEKSTQKLRRALTKIQVIRSDPRTPEEVRKIIRENDYILQVANNITSLLPDMLASTGEKKYLLLFQNNMELRPGGGFIGSYGVLPIEKGKIGEVTIHDVYDADGQLKGHVEPPYGLRRFGGIKHWYLRDSNFHVDSEENGKKAMYFYELETSDKVDGVIAIDTEVLKGLVREFGPFDLQQYNRTVNEENIVMMTQEESQDNFFPGSTQKKEFLSTLHKELRKRIQQEGGLAYAKVAKIMINAFTKKHALVVLKDDGSQKVLAASDVSGKLPSSKNENGIINDFLLVSEANIGGTKGNMYLKREITRNIKLGEKNIEHEVKITYQNTSKNDSKYGGEYNGFIQLVVPANATITSFKRDDKELNIVSAVTDPEIYEEKGFQQKEGIEITTESTNEKVIYGFPVTIPTEAGQVITLKYLVSVDFLPRIFKTQSIKQPGTLSDPHVIRIYYPDGKRPALVQGLSDMGNRAEYRGGLVKDYKAEVVFDK
jgi:hypothetical protein